MTSPNFPEATRHETLAMPFLEPGVSCQRSTGLVTEHVIQGAQQPLKSMS